MKLTVPEELQEHLTIMHKKGFYALYNFKDDILYSIDYFDVRKFRCWLQMHLSGPEMGWKSYGVARYGTPWGFNNWERIKKALQGKTSDTLFFYLGE